MGREEGGVLVGSHANSDTARCPTQTATRCSVQASAYPSIPTAGLLRNDLAPYREEREAMEWLVARHYCRLDCHLARAAIHAVLLPAVPVFLCICIQRERERERED